MAPPPPVPMPMPRFWVQTGTCVVSVYQAFSPPLKKRGPGDEAKLHYTGSPKTYARMLRSTNWYGILAIAHF